MSNKILYRLTQDLGGMPEGSCISENKFRGVYFTDKACFEPIEEYQKKDMIEYEDDDFCSSMGIECILFYNEQELDRFLKTTFENGLTR